MMVTTGGRVTPSVGAPSSPVADSDNFLGGLLFEGDDVGVRSEEARHLAGQFGIERLIDGGENAAEQQARNQVLGANSKLLRQIFDADAFGDGDAARDRLRLVRKRQPRRRRVALHRAFLHPAWNIALSWTARRRTGRLPGLGVGPPDGTAPGPTPSGREPVGDCRVGCMGRRSPGRSGGRLVGAPGRGRWKIGCPGTGRPGAGRMVAPVERSGGACRRGWPQRAPYTPGRGPVCGTIMRGGGGCRRHRCARGGWPGSHGWRLGRQAPRAASGRCTLGAGRTVAERRRWNCRSRRRRSRGRCRLRRRRCWSGKCLAAGSKSALQTCGGAAAGGAGVPGREPEWSPAGGAAWIDGSWFRPAVALPAEQPRRGRLLLADDGL